MKNDSTEDPPGGDGRGGGGHRGGRTQKRADLRAQMRATTADFGRQVQATRAQLDATNERIRARTGRNLVLAVLIGLGLGLVFLASLIIVKELFMLVAMLLLGFAAFEFAGALRTAGRRVARIPTVLGALAIVPATYYWHESGQLAALGGAMVLVCVWRLIELAFPSHRAEARAVALDLGTAILVQVYVAFLGSFTVLLTAQQDGQWWTLGFIIVVILVDTGAYVSGLLFGKHPMAPVISPKKTWEGFAGAALVSIVGGVVLAVVMLGEPWWFGFIFGPALLGSATMGDLIESLIKRDIGVKDMSSWLPGHGGFLDRLDSILPSAIVAYALFVIF